MCRALYHSIYMFKRETAGNESHEQTAAKHVKPQRCGELKEGGKSNKERKRDNKTKERFKSPQ